MRVTAPIPLSSLAARMRLLLLKAGAASLATVLLLWEIEGWFYHSDEAYWRASATERCGTWSTILPMLEDSPDLADLPAAAPDPPGVWAVDCGEGLRIRSATDEFEVLYDAGGQTPQLLSSTSILWPDETANDRLFQLIAILIAGGVASVMVVPLMRRAAQLEATAHTIAAGELDARAGSGGPAELDSLARSINTMADRLGGLLRSRQVMLRAVAHEMGQPLTRMRFTLELLRDLEDPAQREKQCARLESAIERLEALSEGVGEQLRHEMAVRGARLVPTALSPLLRDLIDGLDVGERRLTFEDTDTRAAVDPELFRIAARNLIENALRHARAGVVVRLRPGALIVDDDGPGVPESARAHILQPFIQGPAGGAMGLGLPIVADVARVHGGELLIATSPQGGARFTLRFGDATG